MKRPRPTLFARILLWFFLSLVILGGVLFGFFNFQFDLPPDSPLRGEAGKRIGSMVRLISHELRNSDPEAWDGILDRYSQAYGLDFLLLSPGADPVAGKGIEVPPKVRARIAEQPPFDRKPGGRWMRGMEMDGPPEPPDGGPAHFPRILFAMRTFHPTRYWMAVRISFHPDRDRAMMRGPMPAVLLIGSDSITGGGMLFDPVPWLLATVVVLVLSILLWLPLVRSITRPIGRVRDAADKIARGQFGVTLDDSRKDEIGQLSASINEMAQSLENFMKGQKRFLGDAAHELASPIAKMELAMSILERKVGPEATETLGDLREEVERMGHLVNELLSFSRAELNPGKVRLGPVNVAQVVDRAVNREKTSGLDIRVDVNPDLTANGDPALLERAVANLLRNAIHYAGHAGPIEILAGRQADEVIIEVRDQGSGVPDPALPHLFEPFFRPDPSRGLSTGGVGLGLAIVRTCVQACNGKVRAENRKPGFSVKISIAPVS